MGYYIEQQIPDLSTLNRRWVGHFIKAMMSDGNETYQYQALKANYIRLTDSAIQMYGVARNLTFEYWDLHDGVHISAYSTASSYFESCLTNVHRASQHMHSLLSGPNSGELKKVLPAALTFTSNEFKKKISVLRNTVQHLEQKIVAGDPIPERTFFMPVASGPEIRRGNDTFKQLDRIEIGTKHLAFSDLASWLREMAWCAEILTNL